MTLPSTVVKVGGSLYDLPDLGARLQRLLSDMPRAILIPGGGPTADAIRHLDHVHRLGEEASHWLALRALSVNAHFLAHLLSAPVVSELPINPGCHVLEPYDFCQRDDACPDHLPHDWRATSDSLAVRVAVVGQADGVLLLKSTTWSNDRPWHEAVEAGIVDRFFPSAIGQLPATVWVRVIDLRR
jgi:5-(aminomethyl)-3-furanmethanol phosphate kinase